MTLLIQMRLHPGGLQQPLQGCAHALPQWHSKQYVCSYRSLSTKEVLTEEVITITEVGIVIIATTDCDSYDE